ncbi:MAG: periplasmic heavy metal sensor [Desulfarculaceae bacterium]|nr:periplasmic heavy metal sensor [Desulfarculaceae bacterium]MCF8048760.1 periplasmic heavy metal sensor [Desulfarculaceae bacterium]MCF8064748.1 periplasmic heavy metal sensor [Desulfarculaceae bacterium]MCF8098964.1 periplasmic heavy metal sensor [Desulfarculaceae bacterium]MCF8121814.1 periplasmic heavy metal sensor [Desulfarculaceae bacterium]
MKKLTVILGSMALVATMAVGAWAGPWGSGQGYGRGNCPGYAAGPGGGPGYGPGPNMTKEQFEQFQAKRAAFMKDTLPLRQSLANKRIELRTMYAQPDADQAKTTALRNELIDLRGQLAKKANDAGMSGFGFGRGNRRGPGGGYGPGMGYGPGNGPGSCWR